MRTRDRMWAVRRLGTAVAAGTLLLVWAGPAAPARAATQTVVTIQFDDGNADAYGALSILNAHGMHATFYVNTGVIGDATHMTWAQLGDLSSAGNEVGGHTLYHTNIKKLKEQDARVA